jgi:hypothetical protein
MRVELDPDVWAEIKDVKELLSGDVKAVRNAMRVTVDREGNRSYSTGEEDQMADAMLIRCVTNWSFPLPVPADDPTSLDKLPPAAYEELKRAVEPHFALIHPVPSVKTSSGSSTG